MPGLHDAIDALSAAVARLDPHGEPGGAVSQAEVSALLTAATRLYAACSEDPYGTAALADLRVTPTEACTVAAALLRSQSLTPFEFSIWFSSR
jgi:sugar/nucleoside kinase (ribokinase family)